MASRCPGPPLLRASSYRRGKNPMPMSSRTLAEMEAGARALAIAQGRDPGDVGDLVDKIRGIAERHDTIRQWEKNGLITIERAVAHGAAARVLHHVKNGPTIEETPEALLYGAYPSELLVAQLALAIQAHCAGYSVPDDNTVRVVSVGHGGGGGSVSAHGCTCRGAPGGGSGYGGVVYQHIYGGGGSG